MALSAAAVVSARLAPKVAEAELIRAVQQGDQFVFESLVRSYAQSVLGLAMNLLRAPEAARAAYQEACCRVYKNIHAFRFDCSFYTWLYRIVTNVCLDHLRKRKIRKEEPASFDTGAAQVDRTYAIEEDRAAGNPERSLWNRQLSDRIAEALGQLTPRERMVFELRHYQGMRLRTIGEVLETTEEAAKNCLFRATQKMRAGLGDLI